MQHTKPHSKHFLCLEQMADIGSGISAAGRTITALFNGPLIQFIFGIEKIDFPVIGVEMAVASVSAGVYTVKKVHPSLYRFQNIGRGSHPHQVNRLFFGKIRDGFLYDIIHFLMALPHSQSPQGVAVKVQLCDLFCMFDSYILKNRPLIDAKQELVLINRLFQGV